MTNSDDDIDRLFRENLFRIMRKRGLTAAELSKMASLNARAVKDIEEGRSKSPKLSTAKKLADALGVAIDYLVMPKEVSEARRQFAGLITEIESQTIEKVLMAIRAMK